MSERKFIASSELFSNFEVNICLYSVASLEDIIKISFLYIQVLYKD